MGAGASPRLRIAGPAYWEYAGKASKHNATVDRKFKSGPPARAKTRHVKV
jgi:hypothetical protein